MRRTIAVLLALALASCKTVTHDAGELALVRTALGGHIAELSRAEYGGRLPGSEGDRKTRAYIVSALRSYGLEAGMRRSWEQQVEIPVERYRQMGIDLPEGVETLSSANVVARLPGTQIGSGAVVLTAHWDHLGNCGPPAAPDRLCNGAVDNASGVAALLEIARRMAEGGPAERDIYFVATTGEEAGLVGARAFAEDPPTPLPTIVAAFNLDSTAIAPEGTPVAVLGWGQTALDRGIEQVVKAAGRRLSIRPQQERWVPRQDGYVLLRRDVPSVLVSSSFASDAVINSFVDTHYHRATDEWGDHVELGGAAQDTLLHVDLLRHFGSTTSYPVGDD
ncbi:M20/M25/M40 family metallo-hydrolase [Erythrobacteraceae bacterium WH01K]|nr:M20/M25/M40 family metallo-hydrolase [Erythrobacteraceae bacterium WH01K]